MAEPTGFLVVDIGNSRVKCGEVNDVGGLGRTWTFDIDRPGLWTNLWQVWHPVDHPELIIAISSVNPSAASQFERFLKEQTPETSIRLDWYRSAADVSIPHRIEKPDTAGADRALAVAAAMELIPEERPGLVVSCGTAITIERITHAHVWEGGAIMPGLGLSARALNKGTAQLPLIEATHLPHPWGNSTQPALEAGIFWGVIGGVRELLGKQREDLTGDPFVVWTGGDSGAIASIVSDQKPNIVPHLVLEGLIRQSLNRQAGNDW